MKTKILSLIIAGILSGINIQAAEDGKDSTSNKSYCEQVGFKACINQYPSNVVEFRIQKTTNDIVWVKILDEKGSVLYKKRYKKYNSIELDCDIHDFPTGSYNYVVQLNGEVVLNKTIKKTSIYAG